MKTKTLAVCTTFAVTLGAMPLQAQDKPVQATDLVEIFEKLGGKHPGFRKAHAKGMCATGTFTPVANDEFAGAALLNSGQLPVTMRFSLGGANPASDERAPGTRGLGVQIKLPDGRLHYFTGNNFPVFAGKDPETFFGFLSTLLPDENGKSNPAKTMEFVKNNPSVQANVMWNKTAKTPASYANTQFFGLHTFYYDNADKVRTKYRWEIVPTLGVKTLEKDEAEKMPEAFLADTFAKQLADGEVSFSIVANIGEAEDTDVDPSQQWPADRHQVTLGKLTVSSAGSDVCKNINFDPNILSAGFKSSDDPILRMRSPAYAVSFGKRLSNQ
ncbi:catalase family peroxidase [Alteromonas sp. W364]|uniref:catalase family peroxidase n=1 Tax=Alteromonas sp. W364 TaxID=3075610 RepID=UPI0028865660|nr:catalase family peroxidase [Alteromonas sp. W364]MDT0628740.1 catalase family peroxidase [Alteromonas sp. W364]